jgi:hypothetical protein
LDTRKPQPEKITTDAIAKQINKSLDESKERFEQSTSLLDETMNNLTNDKDRFIFAMLKASFVQIYMTVQIETITGLMTMIMLSEDKPNSIDSNLIEQMQKEIAEIKEKHSPIIMKIEKAFENKKKWMGENR